MPDRTWLTLREAARLLAITVDDLRRLLDDDSRPSWSTEPGPWRPGRHGASRGRPDVTGRSSRATHDAQAPDGSATRSSGS